MPSQWAGIGDAAADQSASSRAVSLILSGNARGAVEPCGCRRQENGGGLARRVALVRRLKAESPGALVVDVGNQTTKSESAPIILNILTLTPYDAVGIGGEDVGLGEAFFEAAKDHGVPLVSATAESPEGPALCSPARFVARDRMRSAITSVSRSGAAQQGVTAVDLDSLRSRLCRLVSSLRTEAETVVVLSDLGYESDRTVFGGGDRALRRH